MFIDRRSWKSRNKWMNKPSKPNGLHCRIFRDFNENINDKKAGMTASMHQTRNINHDGMCVGYGYGWEIRDRRSQTHLSRQANNGGQLVGVKDWNITRVHGRLRMGAIRDRNAETHAEYLRSSSAAARNSEGSSVILPLRRGVRRTDIVRKVWIAYNCFPLCFCLPVTYLHFTTMYVSFSYPVGCKLAKTVMVEKDLGQANWITTFSQYCNTSCPLSAQ